jgi:nuclear pore complex protein Nup155
MQDALLGLTFQDLLATPNGRDVARKIVSAIINMQISRGQSIDAVSDTLQQQCGSFCSADDVYLHKVRRQSAL